MPKNNIEDISTDELTAELGRRRDKERSERLTLCIETCSNCKTSSHLTKWCRLVTYHFEDDVYTQNYIRDDDYYIICPNCGHSLCCRKSYYKGSTPDERAQIQLDRYDRVTSFTYLGSFDKVYEQYNRGYGHESSYKIVGPDGYTSTKIENPFKK